MTTTKNENKAPVISFRICKSSTCKLKELVHGHLYKDGTHKLTITIYSVGSGHHLVDRLKEIEPEWFDQETVTRLKIEITVSGMSEEVVFRGKNVEQAVRRQTDSVIESMIQTSELMSMIKTLKGMGVDVKVIGLD